MTLEELLNNLKNLTYKSEGYDFNVIRKEGFNRVEQLIRQFMLDNHDMECGVLKAKVYTYEQIIAKSNFAPLILKGDGEDGDSN